MTHPVTQFVQDGKDMIRYEIGPGLVVEVEASGNLGRPNGTPRDHTHDEADRRFGEKWYRDHDLDSDS